jgi:transposase
MPKLHKAYPAELKARLVELVRPGRNPEELATKFEPTAQATRNWVKQADLNAGRLLDGLTTDEREELRRLRREVKGLREERDILKRAGAWFARETNAIPSRVRGRHVGEASQTEDMKGRRSFGRGTSN